MPAARKAGAMVRQMIWMRKGFCGVLVLESTNTIQTYLSELIRMC